MMKTAPVPISSVIEALFKKEKSHFSEIYFLFQLSRKWQKLAGGEIARRAVPAQFKAYKLILTLPDSTHLQEMHFVKEALRNKINKHFPDKKIQKIILKVKKPENLNSPL